MCAALATTAGAAVADLPDGESPFGMQKLVSGYMSTVGDDEKEGEGSCGEGSCGATEDKDEAEGSCGEGSCGADDGDDDSKDDAEGSCGEGSCGGQI